MADAEEPLDLVVSYTVDAGGVVKGSDRELQEALGRGYRVIDVLTGQASYGGADGGPVFFCITVVLSRKSNLVLPYRGYLAKEP
jgi:hypothetical protein